MKNNFYAYSVAVVYLNDTPISKYNYGNSFKTITNKTITISK